MRGACMRGMVSGRAEQKLPWPPMRPDKRIVLALLAICALALATRTTGLDKLQPHLQEADAQVVQQMRMHRRGAAARSCGRMPVDLNDLAETLDAAAGAVELRTSSGARIVFDVEEARRADREIRERYGLLKDRSGRLASRGAGS